MLFHPTWYVTVDLSKSADSHGKVASGQTVPGSGKSVFKGEQRTPCGKRHRRRVCGMDPELSLPTLSSKCASLACAGEDESCRILSSASLISTARELAPSLSSQAVLMLCSSETQRPKEAVQSGLG